MVSADGLLAVSSRKWGWVHTALPRPRVCLLLRQTNERPRDKMLRDLALPLKLFGCLGARAHLLVSRLPLRPPPLPNSCGPLATSTHFNVRSKPETRVQKPEFTKPQEHQLCIRPRAGLMERHGRQGEARSDGEIKGR